MPLDYPAAADATAALLIQDFPAVASLLQDSPIAAAIAIAVAAATAAIAAASKLQDSPTATSPHFLPPWARTIASSRYMLTFAQIRITVATEYFVQQS